MNPHLSRQILLGPSTFAERDPSPVLKLKARGYDVISNPYKRKLIKSELQALLKPEVIGLIAGLEPLDRDVLEMSSLRVISRCGSGMSNVDIKAARDLDIQVFSTPNGPTRAVAELTLGALLSLLREIPQMNSSLHNGKWEKKIGFELYGKKAAIIGFGRIGRKVSELLRAFGAEILAVDPRLSNTDFLGVKQASLEEALSLADIVTLHCDGKEPILREKEFKMMKKGVCLLNAARGELIEETSLIKALEEGKVAGAWLDAFSTEPYEGPLCLYPQVILTPHVGSYTRECRLAMEMEAVDNLLLALKK